MLCREVWFFCDHLLSESQLVSSKDSGKGEWHTNRKVSAKYLHVSKNKASKEMNFNFSFYGLSGSTKLSCWIKNQAFLSGVCSTSCTVNQQGQKSSQLNWLQHFALRHQHYRLARLSGQWAGPFSPAAMGLTEGMKETCICKPLLSLSCDLQIFSQSHFFHWRLIKSKVPSHTLCLNYLGRFVTLHKLMKMV